ncbi:MAG: sulfatase [Halobacteriaceae archaeon]
MPRPNLLLLHTDQQRWDALGAAGNDEIHTPNLDRLAGGGVSFSRYFVNAPVCMPSRASYLTGQYPSQLRQYSNGIPLPEGTETLATMLGGRGYHTANLGKLHFLPHANRDHRERHPSYGFDHLEISDEPGCYEDAYRAWVRRRAPDQLGDVSVGLPPATGTWQSVMGDDDISHPDERFPKRPVPFAADADLTHTAFVAERTIEYLREHREDRFCCVTGFYSPHSPWVVPQRFLDIYDPEAFDIPDYPPEADRPEGRFTEAERRRGRHGYYAMVSEVDYHVGRILDEIDELGLRENTLVAFTSDHGELLGEHCRYGKGWPCYDSIARVPLLLRWPGEVPAGETDDGIAEAVDLLPTLLDAAGVQAPPHLLGESLLGDREGRSSALTEAGQGKALRTDRFRYVRARDGEEHLYDIEADPREYEDLADERPDRVAAMRGRLLDRLLAVDAGAERDRTWAY